MSETLMTWAKDPVVALLHEYCPHCSHRRSGYYNARRDGYRTQIPDGCVHKDACAAELTADIGVPATAKELSR